MISARKKWAVLVGANEYHDSAINPLKFCVNDIKSLHEVLVQPDRGGYDEKGTLLLVDGSGRDSLPTRSIIMSRITSVAKMAEPEDTILSRFLDMGWKRMTRVTSCLQMLRPEY